MKKVYLFLLTMMVAGLSFTSCTKEDDLLDDGDVRDLFVGEWSVNDACSRQPYRSSISIDPENSSQVIISNYANLGKAAKAIIAGSSIYIEIQEIGNGYSVRGNGRLNGEIISWASHNFETSGESTECTATYTEIR